MADLGRILIGLGIALAIVGAIFVLGGRIGLGHLPGDLTWRRGNMSFAFPIATCLLASVLLSVILTLLFQRK